MSYLDCVVYAFLSPSGFLVTHLLLIFYARSESLRLFPPVPWIFRTAVKDGHVDGVFVPKGTWIYIPVRILISPKFPNSRVHRSALLTCSLQSGVSTRKSLSIPYICSSEGLMFSQVPTWALALVAWVLWPYVFYLHFRYWTQFVHWKDDGNRRDESHHIVSLPWPWHLSLLTDFFSHLVANFEFKPAYEGQEDQPTAGLTMS